jgi:hypothetical protein
MQLDATVMKSSSVAMILTCVAAAPVAHRTTPLPTVGQKAGSSDGTPTVIVARPLLQGPLLQIENLRLVAPPAQVPQPSAVLKFDVFNDTESRLTDVVMRVSFLEKQTEESQTAPRVVVGPVTVRVGESMQAGHVVSYEMLFRNLSFDCDCAPRVEILSARLLPD